ncbi:MAG: hypothetical protein ABIR80_13790, partial [Opitutaceae bacterium]
MPLPASGASAVDIGSVERRPSASAPSFLSEKTGGSASADQVDDATKARARADDLKRQLMIESTDIRRIISAIDAVLSQQPKPSPELAQEFGLLAKIALIHLAGLESRADRPEDAVVVYQQALKLISETAEPLLWAGIQFR